MRVCLLVCMCVSVCVCVRMCISEYPHKSKEGIEFSVAELTSDFFAKERDHLRKSPPINMQGCRTESPDKFTKPSSTSGSGSTAEKVMGRMKVAEEFVETVSANNRDTFIKMYWHNYINMRRTRMIPLKK